MERDRKRRRIDGDRKVIGASSNAKVHKGTECPYMSTINRKHLDFDFEKVCSVSLERENVYACLACGKYFQGRNRTTPAFLHALDVSHHLYLNLQTERVYCLPDGYRVDDASFEDITMALNPKFNKEQVETLDVTPRRYRTLDGEAHLQGVTGLNNLGSSEYVNVVIQALGTVTPLRNYFLLNDGEGCSSLVLALSEIIRKMWNPRAFRSHVSPHLFMQQVILASSSKFNVSNKVNPVDFLAWLLHAIHRGLRNTPGKQLIKSCFQGEMMVTSTHDLKSKSEEPKKRTANFNFLSLDLPPKPIFKDSLERSLVPQVSLLVLLEKYNGYKEHHVVRTGERLSFRLIKLPAFLVFNIKRFSQNKFTLEKNSAVVHFPLENLEMAPYVIGSGDTEERGLYDLAAAIIHEGPAASGSYRIALKHVSTGTWYEFQDLSVKNVQPQLVSLSEVHVLIYKRREKVERKKLL